MVSNVHIIVDKEFRFKSQQCLWHVYRSVALAVGCSRILNRYELRSDTLSENSREIGVLQGELIQTLVHIGFRNHKSAENFIRELTGSFVLGERGWSDDELELSLIVKERLVKETA